MEFFIQIAFASKAARMKIAPGMIIHNGVLKKYQKKAKAAALVRHVRIIILAMEFFTQKTSSKKLASMKPATRKITLSGTPKK